MEEQLIELMIDRLGQISDLNEKMISNYVSNVIQEYSKIPEYEYDGSNETCSICLNDIKIPMKCKKLPCGHVYHSLCLFENFISKNVECPMCRCDIGIKLPSTEIPKPVITITQRHNKYTNSLHGLLD